MFSQPSYQINHSSNPSKLNSTLIDVREFNNLLKQSSHPTKKSTVHSFSNGGDKSDRVLIDKQLLTNLCDCYNNCQDDKQNTAAVGEKIETVADGIIGVNVGEKKTAVDSAIGTDANENFNIYNNSYIDSLKGMNIDYENPLQLNL